MMKYRLLALSILLTSFCIPSFSYASSGSHTEIVEFESKNKDQTYDFAQIINKNGKEYELVDVQYEIINTHKKMEEGMVEHKVTSEPVIAGTQHSFEEHISVYGKDYTLKDVKELSADPHFQKVTAYHEYNYQVSQSSVPQTKEVSVINENTGVEEMVTCNLDSIEKVGTKWITSYVNIQFHDYDSTSFMWEGNHIPNNPEQGPLAGYESSLLNSVGLTNATGKVLATYWTTEPYQSGNLMYRDGRADIQRIVPIYRANYIGQIQTDYVRQEATYEGTGVIETDIDEYTIQGIAFYKESLKLEYIMAAIVFLVLIVLSILTCFWLHKKSQKSNKGKKGSIIKKITTEGNK